MTKPDLAYTINKYFKYTNNLFSKHFNTIKRIIKYLTKTL